MQILLLGQDLACPPCGCLWKKALVPAVCKSVPFIASLPSPLRRAVTTPPIHLGLSQPFPRQALAAQCPPRAGGREQPPETGMLGTGQESPSSSSFSSSGDACLTAPVDTPLGMEGAPW